MEISAYPLGTNISLKDNTVLADKKWCLQKSDITDNVNKMRLVSKVFSASTILVKGIFGGLVLFWKLFYRQSQDASLKPEHCLGFHGWLLFLL